MLFQIAVPDSGQTRAASRAPGRGGVDATGDLDGDLDIIVANGDAEGLRLYLICPARGAQSIPMNQPYFAIIRPSCLEIRQGSWYPN